MRVRHHEVGTCKDGVGESSERGTYPHNNNDADCSWQAGQGMCLKGIADSDETFHRECGDGQDRGCCSCFGDKSFEQAIVFAKSPWIRFPNGVQFRRQTYSINKSEFITL